MLPQIFCRFEKPFRLFRRDVDQVGSGAEDLVFKWLELSHALHAVRSPGAAQKFQNDRAALPHLRRRESSLAIGGGQREIGCALANGKGLRSFLHLLWTLEHGLVDEQ